MTLGLGQDLGDPGLRLGVTVGQRLLEALAFGLQLGLHGPLQLLALPLGLPHDVLAANAGLSRCDLAASPASSRRRSRSRWISSTSRADAALTSASSVCTNASSEEMVRSTACLRPSRSADGRSMGSDRVGSDRDFDRNLRNHRFGRGRHGHLAQLIGEISEKLVNLLGVVSRGGESE